MKKRKLMGSGTMTFREGCDAYLLNCRQRNLREATLNHYRQSYRQFYKQIDPETPLCRINKAVYDGYVQYLLSTLDNDVSINSYLRDLITTLHFLMREGYMAEFSMKAIRVDQIMRG